MCVFGKELRSSQGFIQGLRFRGLGSLLVSSAAWTCIAQTIVVVVYSHCGFSRILSIHSAIICYDCRSRSGSGSRLRSRRESVEDIAEQYWVCNSEERYSQS